MHDAVVAVVVFCLFATDPVMAQSEIQVPIFILMNGGHTPSTNTSTTPVRWLVVFRAGTLLYASPQSPNGPVCS